jgi:hypothetical protein
MVGIFWFVKSIRVVFGDIHVVFAPIRVVGLAGNETKPHFCCVHFAQVDKKAKRYIVFSPCGVPLGVLHPGN